MHTRPPSKLLPPLLAVSIFMQMLDATILNTALPQMAADLHESPLNMQSAVIAYALTVALLIPASGYLCDRYGTRRIFLAAMLLFVAGSLLSAVSPTLNLLVCARIVQGAGGAMLMVLPRLTLMRAYEKSQLVSMMNYIIMPALLGPILGPLVGGYIVEYGSWPWIFLINLPVGLACLWAARTAMPDFYAADGKMPHFDFIGFLLFGAGAVGLSAAVELFGRSDGKAFAAVCALLGLCSLLAYLRHAARSGKRALYPLQLAAVRTFRLGLLGNLFSRLGMAGVPFLLPLLLQVVFRRPPAESGWLLAPVAFAALMTKPMIKPVFNRFGYRKVLQWNTRFIGLIIMSLALPDAATPTYLLVPLLLCMGVCNSLQYSALNTLTVADLRPHQAAQGSSLMTVNQQLAIGFGIALAAGLLKAADAGLPPAAGLHGAFRCTFIAMGAITFAASFLFGKLHPRDGDALLQRKAV